MMRGVVVASFAVLLGWHCRAVAQPHDAEAAVPNTENPPASVGEEAPFELDPITVIGERTLQAVQREMTAVQNQTYALFNELNTDPDQDIICLTERPRGKSLPRRVCKARFERDAESRASLDYARTMTGGVSPYHVDRREIDRQYEHHREVMAELANSNPEFRALLEKSYALRQEFEAKGGTVRQGIGSQ